MQALTGSRIIPEFFIINNNNIFDWLSLIWHSLHPNAKIRLIYGELPHKPSFITFGPLHGVKLTVKAVPNSHELQT